MGRADENQVNDPTPAPAAGDAAAAAQTAYNHLAVTPLGDMADLAAAAKVWHAAWTLARAWAAAAAERGRLAAEVERLNALALTCCSCGAATPTLADLRAHVSKCPGHPVTAENRRLKAEVERLRAACKKLVNSKFMRDIEYTLDNHEVNHLMCGLRAALAGGPDRE